MARAAVTKWSASNRRSRSSSKKRVEAGPCLDVPRDVPRGERHHDLSICSHGPWMREGPMRVRSCRISLEL